MFDKNELTIGPNAGKDAPDNGIFIGSIPDDLHNHLPDENVGLGPSAGTNIINNNKGFGPSAGKAIGCNPAVNKHH